MKKVWVKIAPWQKHVATASIESGVDALVLDPGDSSKAKELGVVSTVAEDGDLKLGEDVIVVEIKGKADELKVLDQPRDAVVVLEMRDWTVIPVENLVAQREGLMVAVSSAEEARTAVQILEKGADGVVLSTDDVNEIKRCVEVVQGVSESVELVAAKVTGTKVLGMGDRVCVDTCSQMAPGEGMLVGNASDALFLVQSESVENPYVAARPFRVNAGAVHAYMLMPKGKTAYLSDLRSGDEALVVDREGRTKPAHVGRCKIERRPMMLITAEAEGRAVSTIVQNAETIRLVQPGGGSVSVTEIKKGTEVLVHLTGGGRHFGMKVDETLTER